MRLISVRAGTDTVLGVQAGDRWLPAATSSPTGPRRWPTCSRMARAALVALRVAAHAARPDRRDGRPVVEADLLAPVPRPGKVVAIGRNYRDHAAEEGVDAAARAADLRQVAERRRRPRRGRSAGTPA